MQSGSERFGSFNGTGTGPYLPMDGDAVKGKIFCRLQLDLFYRRSWLLDNAEGAPVNWRKSCRNSSLTQQCVGDQPVESSPTPRLNPPAYCKGTTELTRWSWREEEKKTCISIHQNTCGGEKIRRTWTKRCSGSCLLNESYWRLSRSIRLSFVRASSFARLGCLIRSP